MEPGTDDAQPGRRQKVLHPICYRQCPVGVSIQRQIVVRTRASKCAVDILQPEHFKGDLRPYFSVFATDPSLPVSSADRSRHVQQRDIPRRFPLSQNLDCPLRLGETPCLPGRVVPVLDGRGAKADRPSRHRVPLGLGRQGEECRGELVGGGRRRQQGTDDRKAQARSAIAFEGIVKEVKRGFQNVGTGGTRTGGKATSPGRRRLSHPLREISDPHATRSVGP